jgi:hypothetical protein
MRWMEGLRWRQKKVVEVWCTNQNSVGAAEHCSATLQSCCDTRREKKKQNRIKREKEKKETEKGKKKRKRARIRSEDEKYRVFSFVRPQGNPGSSPLAQPAAFCYLGVLT